MNIKGKNIAAHCIADEETPQGRADESNWTQASAGAVHRLN